MVGSDPEESSLGGGIDEERHLWKAKYEADWGFDREWRPA